MTLRTCSRQQEIARMVTLGHWPHACPSELRQHLAECRSCAEFVKVAQAIRQLRSESVAHAKLPSPGAIWWRAQIRRRNAAVQQVGKPILGAYVFAMAITLLVAAAVVVSQARHGISWLAGVGQSQNAFQHAEPFSATILLASNGGLAILISVFAILALVGAVVVFVTAQRQ